MCAEPGAAAAPGAQCGTTEETQQSRSAARSPAQRGARCSAEPQHCPDSNAQRSGRALKSIKERLIGKQGRVRGNLMGKRVDYSARSVIGPDPQLSIRELGVPLKIALNITKPVLVNDRNNEFLTKLVQNGPDEYPGAKILERRNGENISLRNVDRESITLQNGDIVHRHMMNGDNILFNRQPTLHRMSMMSHRVKVMQRGDTFRMNVADTKPYNADFDGDEMNLHMPQDMESESELMNIAIRVEEAMAIAKDQSMSIQAALQLN